MDGVKDRPVAALPAQRGQGGIKVRLRHLSKHAFSEVGADLFQLTGYSGVLIRQVRVVRAAVDDAEGASWRYLQNVVPAGYKEHQEVAVALAAAERLLNGRGACQ